MPHSFPVRVRQAVTAADMEAAFTVRALGYAKYWKQQMPTSDSFDQLPNTVLLLATNDSGQPLGTLRILDSRYGPVEVQSFIPLHKLLGVQGFPVAEATRFAVPRHALSRHTKLALWKAYWLYSQQNSICHMVISTRSGGVPDYVRLCFESLGQDGTYTHNLLGGVSHESFTLHVPSAIAKYELAQNPYLQFFIHESHDGISC